METYYAVGTFAEMLNTHIKYLIKTALEITEIILAKVFRKNKKKTDVVAKIQKYWRTE